METDNAMSAAGPEIDRDTADQEFNRFIQAMDIDLDTDDLDENDRKDLKLDTRRVKRAIMNGRMYINDEGLPVIRPAGGGDELVFHEPRYNSMLAMDSKKESAWMAKALAVIAECTRTPVKMLGKLPARDMKLLDAVLSLFWA